MSWSPEDAEPDHPSCPRCRGLGYVSRYRQTGNPMAADPCGCDAPEEDGCTASDRAMSRAYGSGR